MSTITDNNVLTKKQLMACLERDGVNATEDTKTKAKRNSGRSCYDIGWEYHETIKDYSKAMAWYQIAVSKNYSLVHNNIGLLYDGGLGVPQNHDIAMEHFLKAAVTSNAVALANIGECFLKGQGVPVDEYKALEWFLKSGTRAREVNKLNREGIHLKKGDKKKTIFKLIDETEKIIREERNKKNEKLQELKKWKASKKKELSKLRMKNKKQKAKGESSGTLKQQSKDRHQDIKALKREIKAYELLVQSKLREIEMLKKDYERECEIIGLKRKIEQAERYCREPSLMIGSGTNAIEVDNRLAPTNMAQPDNTIVKTEEVFEKITSRLRQKGNKKRKLTSKAT